MPVSCSFKMFQREAFQLGSLFDLDVWPDRKMDGSVFRHGLVADEQHFFHGRGGGGNGQQPLFVHLVHLVQDDEKVISPFVGLRLFNQRPLRARQAADLRTDRRIEEFRGFHNWEGNASIERWVSIEQALPKQVVQG